MSEIAPALLSERLERARYDIENHIPRALAGQDYIWAEECRRSALNEIIRAVFYMNGLFLRRLKGVPTEAEKLAIRPEGYSEKLKLIATSPVATALPHLSALFGEVAALSEIGPMSPGVGY